MVTALSTRDDLRSWLEDSWTHLALLYVIVLLTLSLIVQIVATVLIGSS